MLAFIVSVHYRSLKTFLQGREHPYVRCTCARFSFCTPANVWWQLNMRYCVLFEECIQNCNRTQIRPTGRVQINCVNWKSCLFCIPKCDNVHRYLTMNPLACIWRILNLKAIWYVSIWKSLLVKSKSVYLDLYQFSPVSLNRENAAFIDIYTPGWGSGISEKYASRRYFYWYCWRANRCRTKLYWKIHTYTRIGSESLFSDSVTIFDLAIRSLFSSIIDDNMY